MTRSKASILASLDTFTRAYIDCALWSSTDESREDGGDPLDQNYEPEDLTARALKNMVADCAAFQARNAQYLVGLAGAQCGHDFWLTRNGHGAGFWDRGLGGLGDKLTEAAHAYGSCDLYVHCGRIYL